MLSYEKSQGTKVSKCDLCRSQKHVDWMCTNCDKIICEKCSKNHKLKGPKYKNHRILKIHGAVEVVVSKSRKDEKRPHDDTAQTEEEERSDNSEIDDSEDGDEMKGHRKLRSKPRGAVHERTPKDAENEIKVEELAFKLDSSLSLGDAKVSKTTNDKPRKLGQLPLPDLIHEEEETDMRQENDFIKEWKSKGRPKDVSKDVYAHVDEDMNLSYLQGPHDKTLSDIKDRKMNNGELSPTQSPIKMIQNRDESLTEVEPNNAESRKNLKGIVFSDSKGPTSFVGLTRSKNDVIQEQSKSARNNPKPLFRVDILSRHPTRLNWINGLCTYDEESAFYGDVNPNCLIRADMKDADLVETLSLDLKVTDVSRLPCGDLLVSYEEGQQISRMDTSGSVKYTLNTSPLFPQGIFPTTDEEMWVCLAEKIHAYKFPKCKVQVVKMSSTGERKKTLEFNKRKCKLFSYPHCVIENANEDICVLDLLPKEKVILLVFDKTLNFRFKYDGNENSVSTRTSDFGQVANDTAGRLLLTDYGCHRIHILSKDGEFLQYILAESDRIFYPFALGITKQNILWIDCKSSKDKDAVSNIVRVKYSRIIEKC